MNNLYPEVFSPIPGDSKKTCGVCYGFYLLCINLAPSIFHLFFNGFGVQSGRSFNLRSFNQMLILVNYFTIKLDITIFVFDIGTVKKIVANQLALSKS